MKEENQYHQLIEPRGFNEVTLPQFIDLKKRSILPADEPLPTNVNKLDLMKRLHSKDLFCFNSKHLFTIIYHLQHRVCSKLLIEIECSHQQ